MFVDDNFMGPGRKGRERAIEFAEAYRRSRLDMTFHIDLRAVDVHEEVIAALVAAGLTSIFIGIESVSDDDLKLYRKDLEADANWQAVEILKRHDLQRTLSMIMFNPSTTPASIVDNCRFLRQAEYFPRNPITILNVYEGTEHSRIYADRVTGPFWDYRFDFENPLTDVIHRATLEFCRESLPLERALSRHTTTTATERQELYRMRLGALEDLALRADREPHDAILNRWRERLARFSSRFGDLPSDDDQQLFLPAPTPNEVAAERRSTRNQVPVTLSATARRLSS